MSGRTSTRDLIAAGIAAVRANPTLVAVRWAGDLAVAALTVAGIAAPPAALFGAGFAGRFAPLAGTFRDRDVDALALAVLDLAAAVIAAPGRLAAGVGALLVLWTLAMVLYCWVRGGVYGVLVAADRAGAAFSFARFAAAGRHLFGRYFWFVNLYATVLLLVALGALLPLALLPPAPPGEPPLAALAVAAAVLPPAAVAGAAVTLWYAAGCAELARDGSSVRAASRRAVEVLRRRTGPVLGVSLLAAGAVLAAAGVAMALGSALALLPAPAALAGGLALAAAEGLAVAAAATAHGAALVRLVRAGWPAPAALEAAA